MTPDNVIVSGDDIYLIDYDCVGTNMLPGFDLLNFILKSKYQADPIHPVCEHYLSAYFENIGAITGSLDSFLFVYHLQETKRKKPTGQGSNADEIIRGFEILLER